MNICSVPSLAVEVLPQFRRASASKMEHGNGRVSGMGEVVKSRVYILLPIEFPNSSHICSPEQFLLNGVGMCSNMKLMKKFYPQTKPY